MEQNKTFGRLFVTALLLVSIFANSALAWLNYINAPFIGGLCSGVALGVAAMLVSEYINPKN